jgi:uncharacterized protein YecT (DUF1311 family)
MAASLVLVAASPVRAQVLSPAHCDSIPSVGGIGACYSALADTTDARLRVLLGELRRVLPRAAYDRVQASQAQWERYRDAQCHFEVYAYEGGRTEPMAAGTCRFVKAMNRIAELRGYLCDDGPETSPCPASERYGEPPAGPESRQP